MSACPGHSLRFLGSNWSWDTELWKTEGLGYILKKPQVQEEGIVKMDNHRPYVQV
jgi:hypothetical protein